MSSINQEFQTQPKKKNTVLCTIFTSILLSLTSNLPLAAVNFDPPNDGAPGRREDAGSRNLFHFEPPNDGAPGRREDAGSRPGCPQPQGKFTALIPATNLGKTLAEHPTLWLYVPYSSGLIEVVLEDEITKKRIYQNQFEIKQKPGITRYQLTSSSPALEVGKKYRWYFFLFCNPANKADVLSVNGVIQREALTPQLTQQLQQATPQQRLDLYAAQGLWYETLTELAQLRQKQPNNPETTDLWTRLLTHPLIRLHQLMTAPIL